MNKVYSISHQLKAAERDYTPLFEAIQRSPKWHKIMDSTWFIVSSETPQQIWNRLAEHIDTKDRLLILEVTNSRYGWLAKESWAWLREELHRPQ